MADKLKLEMLDALRAHFKAKISMHKVNVDVLMAMTVGVAEHPDVMKTIEDELAIIAEYDDKLEVLNKHFGV